MAMKDRAAALRYARALEGALEGDAEIASAADELAGAARVMSGDAVVSAALTSPGLDPGRRKALLDTLVRGAGLSGKAAGLLAIMAENGHLHLLSQMAAHFAVLRDKRLGIVSAVVTTAAPLSAEMAERTRDVLAKRTGRKIRLELKTDPGLIGGMIAQVGSTVYDGSVRARLAALRGHIARS